MTRGVLEAAAWAPAELRGGPHERPTRHLCDAVAAPGSSPAAPAWEVLKGHRPLPLASTPRVSLDPGELEAEVDQLRGQLAEPLT